MFTTVIYKRSHVLIQCSLECTQERFWCLNKQLSFELKVLNNFSASILRNIASYSIYCLLWFCLCLVCLTNGTYLFLPAFALASFESFLFFDLLLLLTCFHIPVLFISSDMFMDANGMFIIFPFIKGIWRFSW